MSEVDPVIFEFHARTSKFRSDVRQTTNLVGGDIDRMEARFRANADRISSTMRGLAGTLAAAFTGRELVGMLDSYTRFQNALKVAGLEGDRLAETQDRLFAIAQRNGVATEDLGNLYGSLSRAAKESGASQAQMEAATSAVAASLRIQGTSSGEAQGSLLQLGQAIASSRVEAEEFNSLIDGMPVLLAAAAKYIDGTGGSVNKLKRIIKDQSGPGVSGTELFQAIAAAMEELQGVADETALTLEAGLTNVASALTRYFGEADQAHGISAALGSALKTLGENVDTIIPALAAIATIIGTRYVVAAGAATASNIALAASATGAAGQMGVMGAAAFALQARLAGAATTTEALGFAMRSLGGALPLAAITAITLGLGYMAVKSAEAEAASDALHQRTEQLAAELGALETNQRRAAAETNNLSAEQRAALTATANLTGEANLLATAWGRVAAEAKRAAIEQAKAVASKARSVVNENRAEVNRVRSEAFNNAARRPIVERGLGRDMLPTNRGAALLAADMAEANSQAGSDLRSSIQSKRLADAEVARLEREAIASFRTAPAASSEPTPARRTGPSRSTSTARSAQDVEAERLATARRATDELARLDMEELRAKIDITRDADERADLQTRLLNMERAERIRQIEQDEAYAAAQKEAQIAAINRLYGDPNSQPAGDVIEVTPNSSPYGRAIQREAAEIAARQTLDQLALQADTLDAMAGVEANVAKRNELERGALAIQQEIERALLDQAIAAGEIADAEEARALLAQRQAAISAGLDRRQRSPLAAYMGVLEESAENVGLAIEAIEVRALDDLNDGLADAILGAESLGDVFSGVADSIIRDLLRIAIQQAVIRPLAESLGSSGGLLGSIGRAFTATLPGRASGGRVEGGQIYRINEGGAPGRVEAFRPDGGGNIIPLGQMGALRPADAASGLITLYVEEAPGFASKVRAEATGVAVEVVKASAPTIANKATSDTLNILRRPTL